MATLTFKLDSSVSGYIAIDFAFAAKMTGDGLGNSLWAEQLFPTPSIFSSLGQVYILGEGGSDVINGGSSTGTDPTKWISSTIMQGSSNTSNDNREIDILIGSPDSHDTDTYLLCARTSSGWENCYKGSGYAILRNFNIANSTADDLIIVKADPGYGQSFNGKRLGLTIETRAVAGIGSTAADTIIKLARTNDTIGIIQDRSFTLSQLCSAGSLEFAI